MTSTRDWDPEPDDYSCRMLFDAKSGTDPWSVVTALGTAAAAIFAGFSAFASWRAASASATSSERATQALATTIVPGVRTRGIYQHKGSLPPLAYVAVNNDVDFMARDVEVEVVMRDGRRFTGGRDFLRKDDLPLIVEIGQLNGPTQPGSEFLAVGRITIRFSDEHMLARYERVEDYSHLSEPPCEPIATEDRLWPTPGPFFRQPAVLG
jgi:hypothetical protein